ncbi:hypothetical protein LPJ53_001920 [Coemansia erecta]|uniref:Signal recognition particle receptor subunit beta n=1 Tax=Coemansia erecta TaxID=147472 RepID=A0A9W7Y4K7_9FUNG|nr:hypothetical protein LPJ53_001920 [Coemansia erecta]
MARGDRSPIGEFTLSSSSRSSMNSLLLTGILVIIILSLVSWFILNQQSAAISNRNLAMAAGTNAAVLKSSKKRNNTVVITGPMGAGKTALWCYLRFPNNRSAPKTQTSMAVNSAEVSIDGTGVYLVDVPGHQRHRFDRDAFLPAARAVIFVVDSAEVTRKARHTAEFLYDVLANKHVQQKEIPVMILCNKQDDPSALSNVRIKAMLEDEIGKLRTTRQADLGSLRSVGGAAGAGGSGAGNEDDDDDAAAEKASDFLGYEGKKFAFEHLSNPVQINESSMAMGLGIGGMEQIKAWVSDAFNA